MPRAQKTAEHVQFSCKEHRITQVYDLTPCREGKEKAGAWKMKDLAPELCEAEYTWTISEALSWSKYRKNLKGSKTYLLSTKQSVKCYYREQTNCMFPQVPETLGGN